MAIAVMSRDHVRMLANANGTLKRVAKEIEQALGLSETGLLETAVREILPRGERPRITLDQFLSRIHSALPEVTVDKANQPTADELSKLLKQETRSAATTTITEKYDIDRVTLGAMIAPCKREGSNALANLIERMNTHFGLVDTDGNLIVETEAHAEPTVAIDETMDATGAFSVNESLVFADDDSVRGGQDSRVKEKAPVDPIKAAQDERATKYLDEIYKLSGISACMSSPRHNSEEVIPSPLKAFVLGKTWSPTSSATIQSMGISRLDPKTLRLLLLDHNSIHNGSIDSGEARSIHRRSQLNSKIKTLFADKIEEIKTKHRDYFNDSKGSTIDDFSKLTPEDIIVEDLRFHFHRILQYASPRLIIDALEQDWYIRPEEAKRQKLETDLAKASESIADAAQSGAPINSESQQVLDIGRIREELGAVKARIEGYTNGSLPYPDKADIASPIVLVDPSPGSRDSHAAITSANDSNVTGFINLNLDAQSRETRARIEQLFTEQPLQNGTVDWLVALNHIHESMGNRIEARHLANVAETAANIGIRASSIEKIIAVMYDLQINNNLPSLENQTESTWKPILVWYLESSNTLPFGRRIAENLTQNCTIKHARTSLADQISQSQEAIQRTVDYHGESQNSFNERCKAAADILEFADELSRAREVEPATIAQPTPVQKKKPLWQRPFVLVPSAVIAAMAASAPFLPSSAKPTAVVSRPDSGRDQPKIDMHAKQESPTTPTSTTAPEAIAETPTGTNTVAADKGKTEASTTTGAETNPTPKVLALIEAEIQHPGQEEKINLRFNYEGSNDPMIQQARNEKSQKFLELIKFYIDTLTKPGYTGYTRFPNNRKLEPETLKRVSFIYLNSKTIDEEVIARATGEEVLNFNKRGEVYAAKLAGGQFIICFGANTPQDHSIANDFRFHVSDNNSILYAK